MFAVILLRFIARQQFALIPLSVAAFAKKVLLNVIYALPARRATMLNSTNLIDEPS